MEQTTLGRTGLRVGVAGLGAGGASRVGQTRGLSTAQSIDLVRAAIDLGVSLIDTAPSYGTEAIVGEAVRGRRERIVISTKVRVNRAGTHFDSTDFIAHDDVVASVESSLAALKTDYLDIVHVHGVRPHQYDHAHDVVLPALMDLRRQGKIRFLGITEGFGVDKDHTTLRRAIADGEWDVLMLGLNVLNPSARGTLLPMAMKANIGTLCMYPVRGALTRPDTMQATIAKLVAAGEIDRDDLAGADPVELLASVGAGGSLIDAAYRFCRHTPGIQVVLFGTSSRDHLEDNIRSINGLPLPQPVRDKLESVFRSVVSENGDLRA